MTIHQILLTTHKYIDTGCSFLFPVHDFVNTSILYTIETHTLFKALLSCIAIPNQRSEQITADGGEISGEEAQDPQPD